MKQRTLERDLLSPKYRQRVVEAKKGKGSYKRKDVKKDLKSSFLNILNLIAWSQLDTIHSLSRSASVKPVMVLLDWKEMLNEILELC